MTLFYHGTGTRQGALDIVRNGLKMTRGSTEMFFGAGAYLSTSPINAATYGRFLVATDIPSFPRGFVKLDYISDPIGTFDQYVEDRRDSVKEETERGRYSSWDVAERALWREYRGDAEMRRRELVAEGYVGGYRPQATGIQIVIYDERFLKGLRFRLIT
jgi:hypothetical protein